MDEIKLVSSFSRYILSKVVNKQIKKKLGDGIEVHVDDFSIETHEDNEQKKYLIDITVDGVVTEEAFRKLCNQLIGSGTS